MCLHILFAGASGKPSNSACLSNQAGLKKFLPVKVVRNTVFKAATSVGYFRNSKFCFKINYQKSRILAFLPDAQVFLCQSNFSTFLKLPSR